MKYDIQKRMYRLSVLLEVMVGVIVTIAIVFSIVGLVLETFSFSMFDSDVFFEYLQSAFGIIIGVEFIKLLFSHTIDSAVEVMLLAIVRMMIIDHATPLNNLFAVISVAILFLVRKYLFVRQLDHIPAHAHSLINALLHPEQEDDEDEREEREEKEKKEKSKLSSDEVNEIRKIIEESHQEEKNSTT